VLAEEIKRNSLVQLADDDFAEYFESRSPARVSALCVSPGWLPWLSTGSLDQH